MQYVKDREKFPQRKMFVTESTSYVSTRGEYEDNREKGYVSNLGKGISWGVEPGRIGKISFNIHTSAVCSPGLALITVVNQLHTVGLVSLHISALWIYVVSRRWILCL